MTPDQLIVSLLHRKVPRTANVAEVTKTASIQFLEMHVGRKGYVKRIVELQKVIEGMSWPGQNNRTSIAGGSRALFLGAQTNRGLQNGCFSKRTFDAQYVAVMKKVHALAKCCAKAFNSPMWACTSPSWRLAKV